MTSTSTPVPDSQVSSSTSDAFKGAYSTTSGSPSETPPSGKGLDNEAVTTGGTPSSLLHTRVRRGRAENSARLRRCVSMVCCPLSSGRSQTQPRLPRGRVPRVTPTDTATALSQARPDNVQLPYPFQDRNFRRTGMDFGNTSWGATLVGWSRGNPPPRRTQDESLPS